MLNYTIDIGNTRIKVGVFENDQLVDSIIFNHQKELDEYLISKPFDSAIVSSVKNIVIDASDQLLNLSHETPLPVTLNYTTPHTLGIDRIAAAVGANTLFPNQPCFVIDAGTCITADLIDTNGVYQGGSISPGIEMKYKAVHNFTDKLPLVNHSDFGDDLGKSTEESIISGISLGSVYEMEQRIEEMKSKYEDLQVIITGGDSKYFESKIKAHIFVEPNLVHIGLNRILAHNV